VYGICAKRFLKGTRLVCARLTTCVHAHSLEGTLVFVPQLYSHPRSHEDLYEAFRNEISQPLFNYLT